MEQVLSFDPRPKAYKRKLWNKTHVFSFFGYDIFFRAMDPMTWAIIDVTLTTRSKGYGKLG